MKIIQNRRISDSFEYCQLTYTIFSFAYDFLWASMSLFKRCIENFRECNSSSRTQVSTEEF